MTSCIVLGPEATIGGSRGSRTLGQQAQLDTRGVLLGPTLAPMQSCKMDILTDPRKEMGYNGQWKLGEKENLKLHAEKLQIGRVHV